MLGFHCCQPDSAKMCLDGEGDCNQDEDCSGNLICGDNNCLNWRQAGGLWDEEDDCCER